MVRGVEVGLDRAVVGSIGRRFRRGIMRRAGRATGGGWGAGRM